MSIKKVVKSNWTSTKLGDILPIRYGKARSEKHGEEKEDTIVFGSSGVIAKYNRTLTKGLTLIIGRKGNVGSTYFTPEPCWPIDTVFYTEDSTEKSLVFYKYLIDYLQLGKLDRSTAIPGLSRDDYNAKEVNIPPLSEQHRIVEEIEKQFTRLDAGVAALKRVQTNLKRYRASVLKAACEGKLVASKDVSFSMKSLGRLGVWSGGGTPSKSNISYWEDGTIPWVSPKDMKTEMILDTEDHITKKAVENSATNLIPTNSVLIVTRSGILKHTLPVSLTMTTVTINQDLKALQPTEEYDSRYIKMAVYAYQSPLWMPWHRNQD